MGENHLLIYTKAAPLQFSADTWKKYGKIMWNFKYIVLLYIHNNKVNNLTWGAEVGCLLYLIPLNSD